MDKLRNGEIKKEDDNALVIKKRNTIQSCSSVGKYVIIILSLFLFLTSCLSINPKRTMKQIGKVKDCRKNWIYKDLENDLQVKVLLFDKMYSYDLLTFPNFIIGTTISGDTIGILDNEYKSIVKKGENITILAEKWRDNKNEREPVFHVYPQKKYNDILCSVKRVYYGKIKK
jgi:hypothetical protein